MVKQLRGCKIHKKWLNTNNLKDNDENYILFRIELVRHLRFLAYKDYISARKLLLDKFNDYHFVGLITANSAIEKYLKAIFGASDLYIGPFHLDKLNLFNDGLIKMGDNGKKILEQINMNVLKALSDFYKLRYFGETEHVDGVRIKNALAELDLLAYLIEDGLKNVSEGKYAKALEDSEHPIYEKNFVLDDRNRGKYLEGESAFYGIKAIIRGAVVEVMMDRYKGGPE